MPRPIKIRKVGVKPKYYKFGSLDNPQADIVAMTVDEYECIRLIDYERLTQDECAKKMKISRPTVSAIYQEARIKIADVLMNGKMIVIDGGQYEIYDNKKWNELNHRKDNSMRIAVTYANGQIFQHFGKTEQFKIYDIDNQEVIVSLLYANGSGHGALAGLLAQHNVDVLICGGIGGGAINAIKAAGITVCAGVSGNADNAVIMYMNETLQASDISNCHHHDDEHSCHSEDHECHCGNDHSCTCGKH